MSQNIWFSFIYNALAMLAPAALLLGAGIALNPAVGAGLMILQTLLIFSNVYRFNVEADSPVEHQTPVAPLNGNTHAASGGVNSNNSTLTPEPSYGPLFPVPAENVAQAATSVVNSR